MAARNAASPFDRCYGWNGSNEGLSSSRLLRQVRTEARTRAAAEARAILLNSKGCRAPSGALPYRSSSSGSGNGELIQLKTATAAASHCSHHRNVSTAAAATLAEGVGEAVLPVDKDLGQWWVDSGGRLPSIQRILLEAQWQSIKEDSASTTSFPTEKDSLGLENKLRHSENAESAIGVKVVRSGKASARQRRLAARLHIANSLTMEPSTISGDALVQVRKSTRYKKPLKGFVNAYLKHAVSHNITAEEQQVMWRKMQNARELLREKKKLQLKLGYEPSIHQLAEALAMPAKEVAMNLREGGIAKRKMLLSNLKLVVSIAKNYENMGVALGDLIQEGTFGLAQGLEKFDTKRGFKFSTYAYWWIFQAMIRSLDKYGKAVRYPFHLSETIRKINQLKSRRMGDGPLAVESIMDELKLPKATVDRALQASNYKLRSLNQPVGSHCSSEKGDTLQEFLADPHLENQPWLMAERIQVQEELHHLLRTKLDPREREVISKRFGLDHRQTSPLSRYDIGTSCGLSRERVRQLENNALRKLRACRDRLSIDFLRHSPKTFL